jgi:hypothetical protein
VRTAIETKPALDAIDEVEEVLLIDKKGNKISLNDEQKAYLASLSKNKNNE